MKLAISFAFIAGASFSRAVTSPCCQGSCQQEGEEKYFSIAEDAFGNQHCGECCMNPNKYPVFHFFEKNLTKARVQSPCAAFNFTKYDSTVTHGFGPVSMTLDLYDPAGKEPKASTPCCQGTCNQEGEEKYFSIAEDAFGNQHCGECCMKPNKYPVFHFFEKNLTKATVQSPCAAFNFTKYDSTVTHGFGPVSMTLDLYDPAGKEPKGATPCCQGICKQEGEEKYFSIAEDAFGNQHCGECCMNPNKYSVFHFFEKNLTKATVQNPCASFGYTKYDSTVTHGFGPVSMTLDLYDVPATNGSQNLLVI